MHKTGAISGMFLSLATILIGAIGVAAQTSAPNNEQRITVTVRPAQTVEERVADEMKEKELRRAAEERIAAERSAQAAANDPKTLLRRARTVYVSSGTSFFEPVQLQNALRKREEFDVWGMTIIDGWDKRQIADVVVQIDRPLFTYTFTYQITHRSTGIVLATGKIIAFDGNDAAPMLARKIIEEVKKARGETKARQ